MTIEPTEKNSVYFLTYPPEFFSAKFFEITAKHGLCFLLTAGTKKFLKEDQCIKDAAGLPEPVRMTQGQIKKIHVVYLTRGPGNPGESKHRLIQQL